MQDTEEPQPPLALPDSPKATPEEPQYLQFAEAYEQLAVKVSELESALSGRILSLDEKERELRLEEISQRMAIRKWTGVLAGTVVVSMVGMLIWSKCTTGLWWLLWAPDVHSVAVVIAPTVSATAIVVALLWGAFRRFKDDDPEKVMTSTPVNLVVSSLSGNQ